jgi:hypothetical protein
MPPVDPRLGVGGGRGAYGAAPVDWAVPRSELWAAPGGDTHAGGDPSQTQVDPLKWWLRSQGRDPLQPDDDQPTMSQARWNEPYDDITARMARRSGSKIGQFAKGVLGGGEWTAPRIAGTALQLGLMGTPVGAALGVGRGIKSAIDWFGGRADQQQLAARPQGGPIIPNWNVPKHPVASPISPDQPPINWNPAAPGAAFTPTFEWNQGTEGQTLGQPPAAPVVNPIVANFDVADNPPGPVVRAPQLHQQQPPMAGPYAQPVAPQQPPMAGPYAQPGDQGGRDPFQEAANELNRSGNYGRNPFDDPY